MLGSTTRSQPFLNMLNPMGAARGRYAGYAQARQDVLEEDEDEGEHTERENISLGQVEVDSNVEAGSSRMPPTRRVSSRAGTGLRPNIHSADANESSDDEVPQSFMIETNTPSAPARPRPKTKSKGKERERPPRAGKAKAAAEPPILPVGGELPLQMSIPPRPSEVNVDDPGPEVAQPARQMRGLDAYERALWNWVNVYNLDAFLQEVYFYYEGKGIYCIALARGLNLL
jgi:autophagy-related protein 9